MSDASKAVKLNSGILEEFENELMNIHTRIGAARNRLVGINDRLLDTKEDASEVSKDSGVAAPPFGGTMRDVALALFNAKEALDNLELELDRTDRL